MAAGGLKVQLQVHDGTTTTRLNAGGASHLIAYVGHNGLMDFELATTRRHPGRAPSSAVVLACASKPYFADRLKTVGSHPLLLTTGLMAPEAYTLDAAIQAWVTQRSADTVHAAAAEAYDRYQQCGLRAAHRLFWRTH